MDEGKAGVLAQRLLGQKIGGWAIDEYIDCGKSAAVFHGRKESFEAAIKVFDSEIIAKYGDQSQLKRIERERSLIGKNHPNLVKIYDGGFDNAVKLHFVVMEYIKAPNLAKTLTHVP